MAPIDGSASVNLRGHARRRIVAVGVSRIVLLDILGNVDQHWTRPISSRQGEGLPYHRRDARDVVNEKALLSDEAGDRDNIHFLKGILAKQVGRNIAGDRDNRH